MALVLVLWMVSLLTVIAGSFVLSTRTESQLAGNMRSLSQAQALADAGVHRAIYELLRPINWPDHWRDNGLPHVWEFGGATIVISIIDESGKVDINTGAEALIKGLLRTIGVPDERITTLYDSLQDWIDADDFKRLHGAESPDYLAAGRDYRPANAALRTEDDLRQVLRFTEDDYRKLSNLITVHSRQQGINAAVASRTVLLSLPGATPEMIDGFVEQRRLALLAGLPVPALPIAQNFPAEPSGIVSIRSEVKMVDNTRFIREAVLRLDPTKGAVFFAWRAPRDEASSP